MRGRRAVREEAGLELGRGTGQRDRIVVAALEYGRDVRWEALG